MIRLLTQSEINTKKNTERQREIDEGKKLTRAVDSLREIKLEEDAALKKFREETIKGIHIEIVAETDKRETLKAEVTDLEKRKAIALKPIEDEIGELNELKHSLQQKESVLDTREADIAAMEKETRQKSLEIRDEMQRVQEMKKNVQTQLEVAEGEREKARKASKQAVEANIEAQGKLALVNGDIKEKERVIGLREKTVSEKEKEVAKQQKENSIERKQLADMRKTLERELNKIKK